MIRQPGPNVRPQRHLNLLDRIHPSANQTGADGKAKEPPSHRAP